MALVEWRDTYSLGIASLDDQHKGLLQQMNILHDAMSVGKAKEVLNQTFQMLIDYTLIHFKSEEIFFSRYDYSKMEKHMLEHEFFVKKVYDLKAHYDNARFLVCFEVLSFLKTWFVNHILGSDMEYRTFLISKGVV